MAADTLSAASTEFTRPNRRHLTRRRVTALHNETVVGLHSGTSFALPHTRSDPQGDMCTWSVPHPAESTPRPQRDRETQRSQQINGIKLLITWQSDGLGYARADVDLL